MKPSNARFSRAVADPVPGRVRVRPWVLVLALLVAPTTVQAQDQPPCEDVVLEAADLYTAARFDEAISRLQACLNQNALTDEDKLLAHEILAKSYLKLRLEDQARAALVALLTLDVNYEPDPFDDEEYKNLVDEVRRTVVTPSEPAKKPGLTRWLLIGGGAVVAGAAACALLKLGPCSTNGNGFPTPPGRPPGGQ